MWVHLHKGTRSLTGLGVISDPHNGLPAGIELPCDSRNRFSAFNFLAHDLLLIG